MSKYFWCSLSAIVRLTEVLWTLEVMVIVYTVFSRLNNGNVCWSFDLHSLLMWQMCFLKVNSAQREFCPDVSVKTVMCLQHPSGADTLKMQQAWLTVVLVSGRKSVERQFPTYSHRCSCYRSLEDCFSTLLAQPNCFLTFQIKIIYLWAQIDWK